MPKNTPTPEEQLQFFHKIQRLLDEGSFTSTYKYALLIALADLSVEKGSDSSDRLTLTKSEIAEKFIQMYWRQAKTFPSSAEEDQVLFQNNKGQITIVSKIIAIFSSTSQRYAELSLHALEHKQLMSTVKATLESGPLWRLQILGSNDVDDFLYAQVNGSNEITLRDGIAFCFRRFYNQIVAMVQGSWVLKIRSNDQNIQMLGQNVPLRDFLFGVPRNNLQRYVPILKKVQNNLCFYCSSEIKSSSEVDHFIPWARYQVDLSHNFVLACKSCNAAKGCMLASIVHLSNWSLRNREIGEELATTFVANAMPQSMDSSLSVAKWAYKYAEDSESHLWIRKKEVELATNAWETILY